MSQLIDVAHLDALIDQGRPLRLLDVRWRLDEPEGRPAYLAGHIPNAVYVDLERELASPGHPERGRHPLPSVRDLEQSARRWGVHHGDIVIVYDDIDGIAAARAWWLMRRRGVDIRVLNGGLRSWIATGRLLDAGDVAPEHGDVRLTDADPGVASIDDVARAPGEGVLIDARAPQHYRGVAPSADPLLGHVPGAINVPVVTHTASDGKLKEPAEVGRIAAGVGIHPSVPVIVYCSSGVASSHTALALSTAGIDSRIFPGSWSQWSRSPGRPVALGPYPSEHVVGAPWRKSAHL